MKTRGNNHKIISTLVTQSALPRSVLTANPPDTDDNGQATDSDDGKAQMHTEQPGNLDGFGFCLQNGPRKAFREKTLIARNVTRGGLAHGPGPYIYPPW